MVTVFINPKLEMILVLFLAGWALAVPTTEPEDIDGEVSRKVLGSSVVTSVSVIMDVGNGSQTYFTDAVGKPVNKPSIAAQLASPINLLNPDRYEFYTFDDSGDLIKRLMTLDEIQGIIASGDGEGLNYNSQSASGDIPEKRVDDIVNNVQNVLKEEMEAHKITPGTKPEFDTPDVTSTWDKILPSIFGNYGEDVLPDKSQSSITAETIMIETTTLLPLELNQTQSISNYTEKETTVSEIAKTESPVTVTDSLDNNLSNKEVLITSPSTTSSKPVSPQEFTLTTFTVKPNISLSTTMNLNVETTTNYNKDTDISQVTSTKPPVLTTAIPSEQLSTFFIIDDYKHRPESTTKVYYHPSPFTLPVTESSLIVSTETKLKQNTESTAIPTTISSDVETSTVNDLHFATSAVTELTELKMEENSDLQYSQETVTTTLENISTDKVSTLHSNNSALTLTANVEITTVPEEITTSKTEELFQEITEQFRNSEKDSVTLLNHLLSTTDIYQINAELYGATTLQTESPIEDSTLSNKVSTEQKQTQNLVLNVTEQDLPVTTETNIISSIEQLIAQAEYKPEEVTNSTHEGEIINGMVLNTNTKPMSHLQHEAATIASSLIGTPNTEASLNITLSDEKINEAVDSLLSQVMHQQPNQLNIETSTTTNFADTVTTTQVYETPSTIIDDKNRYEEIDLENVEFSTKTYETETVPPSKIFENTENILLNKQTTHTFDSTSTTEMYPEDTTVISEHSTSETNIAANLSIESSSQPYDTTSTEKLSLTTTIDNNEILTGQATQFHKLGYNTSETSSEPFLILALGSSEYPDYTSTENTQDIITDEIRYDTGTEENLIDFTATAKTDVTSTQQTFTQTIQDTTTTPQTVPEFINVQTITMATKIENYPELKLVFNNKTSTVSKPNLTWSLVSTVMPHKTTVSDETNKPEQIPITVDLVPKPLQGFGLEDSTLQLDKDILQFTDLCNELAFSFWNSVTNGISFARSVIVSPFAATSMLAMVFLGARGSTSGEMNEILKLDDMVTFNPHAIFKNVIESIEVSKRSGVATSVFIKELYSDKSKGKLLNFYKERVKQFYDGHVEEVSFKEINDVIRRRTNLLVKRHTWGKIPEYLKDNNLFLRPPLAAISANIFQTDCSRATTEGRDGELHFVVLPSIRQRKLVPVPAVVWRSGFLAGYDPGLDATAVSIGGKDQTISTIFVIPGQQGISAPGDGLVRLEARLIESAFRQGAWSRLLRSLIPRPGLEVQIPRFSHKSLINATTALQRMGLKDLFNANTADLKGLNGVAHELYLSDIIQINTFSTCGEGRIDETHHSEIYPATTNRAYRKIRKIHHVQNDKPIENSDLLEEPRDYQRAFHDPLYDPSYLSLPLQLRPRQARLPEAPRLRFDRPFLYFVRHNPTGLILHMGRFNPRLLP